MELLTEIIIGVTGLVTGSALGYCVFRLQQKNNYSAELFNEYKLKTQELAVILEDLLTLSMLPRHYSTEYCRNVDKELSKYFFKYYLDIPQEVLEEINCLHACLQCRGKYLFMVDKTGGIPVLRPRRTTKELNDLFNDVALIMTWNLDGQKKIPRSIVLRCQARHVITVMHNCWKYKEIHKWPKKLPKRTVLQLEKSNKHKHFLTNH